MLSSLRNLFIVAAALTWALASPTPAIAGCSSFEDDGRMRSHCEGCFEGCCQNNVICDDGSMSSWEEGMCPE